MKKHSFLTITLGGALMISAAHPALAAGMADYQTNTLPHLIMVNGEDKTAPAKEFITQLAKDGIGLISQKDISDDKRQKDFRKLLQKNFDMRTIGRFALGRYWKNASKAQQTEYLKLFENMIVKVYSSRFKDYDGQALEVKNARADGENDTIVFSEIVPQDGPKIKVDWRVRNKNGKHGVVDIIVEGVSMSLTQRSDFASVIQRGGGDIEVLLEHLRKE